MVEVIADGLGVHGSDHEEIDPHAEIGECEVAHQEFGHCHSEPRTQQHQQHCRVTCTYHILLTINYILCWIVHQIKKQTSFHQFLYLSNNILIKNNVFEYQVLNLIGFQCQICKYIKYLKQI